MKTSVVLVLTAVVAVLSPNSASAMKSYLKKFPNGDLAFTQALGHVGETDALNDFGKLYSKSGGDWSKMCQEKFPGTAMTVGQAFGDPCCTWKDGGKPDFNVEPFTLPTKSTECATNKAPASAAPSPAATPAPTSKPTASPTTTPAPASKPAASKPNLRPGDKCGVKRGNAVMQRENKSIEDDTSEEAADY